MTTDTEVCHDYRYRGMSQIQRYVMTTDTEVCHDYRGRGVS